MKHTELKNELEDRIIDGDHVSSKELMVLTFRELQSLTSICFGGVLNGDTKTKLVDRIQSALVEC